jgi:uncharacterized protein (DUF305 family)
MNIKIKLSIVLAAGMYLFTSCHNDKTVTGTEKADSTKITNTKNDTMDTKMDANDMTKMDNGLMSSMNAMMDKMSNMKMSGDFDLDFANMMIEHHQGAIDMSNIEIAKGTDEKIRGMAKNIITSQTEEIGMLRETIKNFKASGMKHGEGALQKTHSEMKTAMSGMQMAGTTDKDFATMMISHHESAVKMFKAELANGMNDKLKQMAKKGIADQTKEIGEFKTWLAGNK